MAVYGGGSPQRQVTFDWIGEAFNEFKKYPLVWIGTILIAAVPPTILILIAESAAGMLPTGGTLRSATPSPGGFAFVFLAEIAAAVYGAWVGAGMFKAAAMQIRGEPIDFHTMFSNSSRMWAFLGYSILAGIAADVGIVLCILPFFVVLALVYPGLVLVADGVPVSEAMNRSINGMKPNWLMGGLLVVAYFFLYLISAFACGLGVFVTAPMGILIIALAARDLCGLPGPGAPDYGVGVVSTAPGVWPPAPSTGFTSSPPVASPGFGSPVTPPPTSGFGGPLASPPPTEDETPPA